VNPSIIQGRRRGINIREAGSGNPGTTNCLRVMGKRAALRSLAFDVSKGAAAAALGSLSGTGCAYACALACLLGSIWPVYYRFRGGKGAAACLGAVLALNPALALLSLGVAAIVVLRTRMVSAGSVLGSAALPVFAAFLEKRFVLPAGLMAGLILFRHRGNIQRILQGKESRLEFGK